MKNFKAVKLSASHIRNLITLSNITMTKGDLLCQVHTEEEAQVEEATALEAEATVLEEAAAMALEVATAVLEAVA